ncbi:ComF family protein [Pseudohoeflea coraliihabitans]|uniref:ComF family protein n=1 Tax=Pseudohoeflea coraliihabitans TaxID=2860393 RepID=A0ABS6WKK0_9HYPH|nr:ComF family protein [Pseudohoeflea sp. DP4N28-3]MBW3096474.1 ComF family protein [Pseudohoeflea sp. DP4N28-3]
MVRLAAHRISGAVRAGLKAVSAHGLALVYPPLCMNCNTLTGSESGMCAECWRTIPFIEQPFCAVSGLPFSHERGEGMVSAAMIADPPVFAKARAAVLHEGPGRQLVHLLKYADRSDLAPGMARWMLRAGHELLESGDVLIAVPLHPSRLRARSYNQAGELARILAQLSRRPQLSGVLVRRKATLRQVGLGRQERIENLRGAFFIEAHRRPLIADRSIVLIDDVLTTGATANAAARTLLKAGASQVSVLTFARVASEGAELLYA